MFRRAELTVVRGGPVAVTEPEPGRLERMFRAHHELVWRMLRRRGLPADTAADLAQQAFLVAAERLNEIHRGSERAFLVGTALRLARSATRRALRMELADDMDVHAAGGADGARWQGDDGAAIDLLDLILSKIDADLVEVFVLFELAGFSSPEIAKLMEVPLGTVASRLRRAREAFRAVAGRMELALAREGREREGSRER